MKIHIHNIKIPVSDSNIIGIANEYNMHTEK